MSAAKRQEEILFSQILLDDSTAYLCKHDTAIAKSQTINVVFE
jgi:hypothetical protein